MLAQELSELFARDLIRWSQELKAFPDTATLWLTVPGISNAAGTLTLHVEGNLREYVGRQIGGIAYRRDRPAEFAVRNVSRDELLARVADVAHLVPGIVAAMTPDVLDESYSEDLFNRRMSTRQVVVHLAGHLNYHLGQLDYLRRVLTASGAISLVDLPASSR